MTNDNTQVVRITTEQLKQRVTEGVIRLLKEIAESEETPAVYVGTYGKYNNGSIAGKWVDLTQYDNYEDLMQAFHEIHKDESDPELMYQDWEYIPDIFISESHISDRIYDYINERDDLSFDAKMAIADHCSDEDEYFRVLDDVILFPGCKDMQDVADQYIEMCGGLEYAVQNLQDYFDYEAFGRDVRFEGNYDSDEYSSIYEYWGLPEDASDEELGEAIVNEVGWEGVGERNLQTYFDYNRFGRALESEGTFVEYSDGFIEII